MSAIQACNVLLRHGPQAKGFNVSGKGSKFIGLGEALSTLPMCLLTLMRHRGQSIDPKWWCRQLRLHAVSYH